MATFQYIAMDAQGKEQRGTVDASDRAQAIAAVRIQAHKQGAVLIAGPMSVRARQFILERLDSAILILPRTSSSPVPSRADRRSYTARSRFGSGEQGSDRDRNRKFNDLLQIASWRDTIVSAS